MGYLIALALFVAFCAALLSPYGRRLLAVMFGVLVVLIGVLWVLGSMQESARQRAAQEAADQAAHSNGTVIGSR